MPKCEKCGGSGLWFEKITSGVIPADAERGECSACGGSGEVCAPVTESTPKYVKCGSRAKIGASEGGHLVLDISEDGDVWVTVENGDDRACVRFCTAIGGGSRTSATRKSLRLLASSMAEDGGEVS